MLARLFSLSLLVFCSHVADAQKFRGAIHFSVLYDDMLIRRIPSYIEVHGLNFAIHTEGIYNKSTPKMSMEGGYRIETDWGALKKLYTGVTLGYRRVDVSYFDKNLYYLKLSNGEITEISFEADVKRNFTMIQIPVGITVPLRKGLAVDFSARNNFILKVSSSESVNDRSFEYKLITLERRSSSKYMLELSGGITYSWPSCTIGLKYIQGLTPLYPDTENAYNQIIPSKLYFSSVSLLLEASLGKLFRQNNK